MPLPPLVTALAAGPVVLDGGLATELEAAGHDVSGRLWSARLLADDPDAVVAAHRRFFAAGARVATTASYQASAEGFAAAGVDVPADELLTRSVVLAQRARAEHGLEALAWVAASVGPYGAVRADGSEYTGSYADPARPDALDVAALRRFHRPRLEVLAAAGADVLACETLPAAAEVEALLLELEPLGVPAWVSLTTVVDERGTVRTRLGEPAEAVFAMLRGLPFVVAAGVNCLDPGDVAAAVTVAGRASGLPVVAYPNSGERWDAGRRAWSGDARLRAGDVRAWRDGGARLVGGCCRVGPAVLAGVAAALAD